VDYYTVNIDGKDYICIAATENKSENQWKENKGKRNISFPYFFSLFQKKRDYRNRELKMDLVGELLRPISFSIFIKIFSRNTPPLYAN
jgi:hypothetical protein